MTPTLRRLLPFDSPKDIVHNKIILIPIHNRGRVMQVEKTVFICHRPNDAMTARTVSQHLRSHGFDCSLESESIGPGSLELNTFNLIAARAHFIVILTPSALKDCAEPNDLLRREIEYALNNQRNIVPLMFEGFIYRDVQKYLTGKLEELPGYNSVNVPMDYFEEAMTRLENRFLNLPLDVILHPLSMAERQVLEEANAKINQQPNASDEHLSAKEWFDHSSKRATNDYDGKIADYTKAIHLDSQFALAYYNRGNTYYSKQDFDKAIDDYTESIRLNSRYASVYNNRGWVFYRQGKFEAAIKDYETVLQLTPNSTIAKENLALAQKAKKNKNRGSIQ